MLSTSELDCCILRFLDWRERDHFERADLETDAQRTRIERSFGESSGTAIPPKGAKLTRVLTHVRELWPETHQKAVDAALARLESAGLVRREKTAVIGGQVTVWRVNIDDELAALLYRIEATAPEAVELSDADFAKLDAYLSVRDQAAVTLSRLQNESARRDRRDAEESRREHLRVVLERNRKMRDSRTEHIDTVATGSSVASVAAYVRSLADSYDADKPHPKPVARAGQALDRAIKLGALGDDRFIDLRFALQNCREGRTALEGWRVYFGTAVKWFAEHRDTLTDPPAFHEGPERVPPGLGYNGEWVRVSLSAVAVLLETESAKLAERIVAGTVSAPKRDLPDERGYVETPTDPTAYVSASDIVNKHTLVDMPLTVKQLAVIVEDFATHRVRWTRPRDKQGKPIGNRRNVHLGNWAAYCKKQRGTDADGFPRSTPEGIEARKQAVHHARQPGK